MTSAELLSDLDETVARQRALGNSAAFDKDNGWAWIIDRRHHLVRLPLHEYREVPVRSLWPLLRSPGVWSAEFLTKPSDTSSSNAIHYVAAGDKFGLELMGAKRRSRVRKSMGTYAARPTTGAFVRLHGLKAAADTASRHGLAPPSAVGFQGWMWRLEFSGAEFWCASRNEYSIDAWAAVRVTGNTAVIPLAKSVSEELTPSPNEALVFAMCQHYFSDREVNTVSYGLSSLATSHDKARALDHFKTQMGFEPIPVLRNVVLPWRAELFMATPPVLSALSHLSRFERRYGLDTFTKMSGLAQLARSRPAKWSSATSADPLMGERKAVPE